MMIIIDAYWEKRNLGVDVIEIELEKKDLLDTCNVMSKIAELRSPGKLINIKIPAGSLNLLHALENVGFRFLECQIKLTKSLKNYEPPAEMKAMLLNTSVQIIEKNAVELQDLLVKITPGMFSTDRICLDPLWRDACEDLSATRYKNWIADVFFEDNIVPYYVQYFGQNIAFAVARTNQKTSTAQLLLGGVFKEKGNPISCVAGMNAPLILFKSSLRRVKTTVSSNNISIFKLYNKFNYQIEDILYVLRLFCDR